MRSKIVNSVYSFRRFAAMAALSLAGLAANSCLLTGSIPPLDDTAKAEGSCMCAVCWNQPFCWDQDNTEDPWSFPVNNICAVGIPAEPASRVVSSTGRQAGFFCIPPQDGLVNSTSGLNIECPAARQEVEHIDPCIDLPECARPAECGGPPPTVTCPQIEQDPRPEVCVSVPDYDPEDDFSVTFQKGSTAAVAALVTACDLHGPFVPTGEPSRYCYLACVSGDVCGLDAPYAPQGVPWCHSCGTTATASSAQVHSAFPVEVSSVSGSTVTITVDDGEGNFVLLGSLPVEGSFRLSVPENCHGASGVYDVCTAVLKSVYLFSSGSLVVEDETIDNIKLSIDAPVADQLTTDGLVSGMSIGGELVFDVLADFSQRPAFDTFTPSDPVDVDIDWATGQATITAGLTSSDGQVMLAFSINGTYGSLPPVAVAQALSPVECGIDPIALDGTASYDPNGVLDIVSYNWTSDLGEADLWSAPGVSPSFWHRTPGQYRFYLTTSDAVSSRSTDYVDVELIDSLPPVLDVGPDIFLETCDPIPPPLFDGVLEDDCDTEPTLDIRIVEINGIATSLPFEPGVTRLTFGKTVLLYTAYDDGGNSASGQHAVFLEKGQSCCDAGASQVIGTSFNDILTSSTTTSCMVGLDGDDTAYTSSSASAAFFGGLGDDELHDTYGNLTFAWGGIGDDNFYVSGSGLTSEVLISGGPGTDVVIFSGSRPVRLRGGAGLDDLNSGTSQVTTFVVGAPCEIVPGEWWSSAGPTVVESPVSITELKQLGLSLSLGQPVTYVMTGVLNDAECP